MSRETLAPLDRAFYERPALDVARGLIGTLLVYESPWGRLSGRIVETEAYSAPDDSASHAYRGETPRNRVMFGPAGHAYVYVSYGLHHMLNVVAAEAGIAAAVLVRAIEPVDGVELMARNRGSDAGAGNAGRTHDLTNGPGRLCQAMAIGRNLNGSDITRPPLYILPRQGSDLPLVQTTRIGITRSVDLPWRFYLLGSAYVSVRDRKAERRLATELHPFAYHTQHE